MILEILKNDGFSTARKTASEYASACPFCGGVDRFQVWPGKGTGGRYWCRSCGMKGDAIQYLKDKRGLSYLEACTALKVAPKVKPASAFLPGKWKPSITTRAAAPTWTPSPAAIPPALWRERLYALTAAWSIALNNSGEGLKDHERARVFAAQTWLEGRGITPETAMNHRLGFCPWERWKDRADFGLPEERKPDGSIKRFWLPSGLSIPTYDQGGDLIRVRIRRFSESGPKYVALSGSCHGPMVLGEAGRPFVVVESELDAILLSQEAGDLAGFVALGNNVIRPDAATAELLRAAPVVLAALDGDKAGAKEAWQWWPRHFPNTKRHPPIGGKDPGDMFKAGVNLRTWIKIGLEYSNDPIRTEK